MLLVCGALLARPTNLPSFRASVTFPRFSRTGRLVHVRSEGNVNNGCGEYNHDLPNDDWVALIERGQCYFTQKIRVATKDYNASAVIVYDNEATVHLVSMESYGELGGPYYGLIFAVSTRTEIFYTK